MAEDQFSGVSTRRDMTGTKARMQQVQNEIDSADVQPSNSVAVDGNAVTVSKSLTAAIEAPDSLSKTIEALPEVAYQTAGVGSMVTGVMGEGALTTALSAGPTIVQPDAASAGVTITMAGADRLEGTVEQMAERTEAYGSFSSGSVDVQLKESEVQQLEGDMAVLTAADRVGKDHAQTSDLEQSDTPPTDSKVEEIE